MDDKEFWQRIVIAMVGKPDSGRIGVICDIADMFVQEYKERFEPEEE